ncbi:tetratricopeptide repeat protein [Hippea sp. KM1]|uniref:tetratricopeptide repeat protein n=1 Tax=Hippea sp. KM1 TaxID=944481 RepID=UPI00046D8C13|nr:tetratricopeptide repeat protein [Hippea sp. KM1]
MGKKRKAGKKKNSFSKMSAEREFSRLINLIEKQNFSSADELKDFLDSLMGKSLDDYLPESINKKERAQDLVYEAYEQPVSKAKKLIKQALELDPDNADAYNYLASIEKNVDKAMKLYEKAIELSKKTLGEKIFEKEKGNFWGILSTRPYMRAKAGLAECFYAKGDIDKAIEIYEEMLELNPGDNQGVRYLLSTLLLEKNDLIRFELFMRNLEDEDCANCNFNRALFYFKKFGRISIADEALLYAHNRNRFVIDYMLGIRKLPKEPPQFIGIGDEDEAVAYVFDAWKAWKNTKGAFEWLREFKQKISEFN